jgi:hypothetical protein
MEQVRIHLEKKNNDFKFVYLFIHILIASTTTPATESNQKAIRTVNS